MSRNWSSVFVSSYLRGEKVKREILWDRLVWNPILFAKYAGKGRAPRACFAANSGSLTSFGTTIVKG